MYYIENIVFDLRLSLRVRGDILDSSGYLLFGEAVQVQLYSTVSSCYFLNVVKLVGEERYSEEWFPEVSRFNGAGLPTMKDRSDHILVLWKKLLILSDNTYELNIDSQLKGPLDVLFLVVMTVIKNSHSCFPQIVGVRTW